MTVKVDLKLLRDLIKQVRWLEAEIRCRQRDIEELLGEVREIKNTLDGLFHHHGIDVSPRRGTTLVEAPVVPIRGDDTVNRLVRRLKEFPEDETPEVLVEATRPKRDD